MPTMMNKVICPLFCIKLLLQYYVYKFIEKQNSSITFINKRIFLSAMEKIRVSVFVDRENKNARLELDSSSSVSDMLKKLRINPVTVIVSRNSELVLEDEKLNDNDEIKILSVISGG